MREKKVETQIKIINHLTIRGEKHTSEKNLLKTLKELQRSSKKQPKKLIKLAIGLSSPTFKLHTLAQKKRKKRKGRNIPAFINKAKVRTSLGIKTIILVIRKGKKTNIDSKFKEELLATAQKKSESIELKKTAQEQILTKKHLLRYYRWN